MATVTVISNSHNPLAPSWDEAIVPTLRKRLESESRILTQRLSTISTSTDDAKQPQPSSQTECQSQSYEDTHDTRHSTSSSRRTPNGTRSHTPTNSANPSQRPSAIPRPSYSRAGERSNASAVRSNAPGPVDSASSNGSRPTTGRKRTQSTPFPFEPSEPTSSTSSGRQLSSSTNSGSGTAKANNGRTTPTPSRIPTVPSRIRSGSQSSQGIGTIGKSTGLKLLPSEPIPNYTSESLSTSFQAQSSSFNVSHQRPSEDHQVSRGNTQQPGGIEESINERISSDEERPFQHWYRGDVARNGGVGEYRVGKRVEMLDIASFGHKSLNKAHRTGTQEGSIFPPTFKERTLRKRAESVSSVERTSLYREASDEIMERVLDETPLTDAETSSIDRRPRRQSIASMERISLYMEPHDLPQVLGEGSSSGIEAVMSLDAQNRTTNKQLPLDLSIPNTTAGKSKPPHPRPRNMSNPRHESKASTSTNASLSETVSFRNGKHPRGRAQSPVERSRTPQKKTDQKRSKSAADPLRHPEPQPPSSTDYTGLANAVPDTRTPVPVDGNWDEMVLPTVARRMGIEYEKKEPAVSKTAEPQIVPAPGTFGFDYSKYRPQRPSEEAIPMSEFGLRTPLSPLTDQEEQRTQQGTPEVTIDKPPEPIQQMRPRRDTLPPFAHYMEAQSPRERQDMPQVVIGQSEAEATQPTTELIEEKEDSGCCKCIVM